MRAWWLVLVAACDGALAAPAEEPAKQPAKQVNAWQAFTVDPYFRDMFSGHTRAAWPTNVPEPKWVADTFANLAIAGYDDQAVSGEVDLWAGAGLDPMKCVPEVVWDDRNKHGVRIDHPPRLEQGANGGWHAVWRFEAAVVHGPAITAVVAYVFCPLDAAHERPPWGTSFHSVGQVIAGPHARQTYCARVHEHAPTQSASLAGKYTMELSFACGVLPRMRGRELVDDCTGDLLLSLDALGPATIAVAGKTGSAISEDELRRFLIGDDVCATISLGEFDAKREGAWQTALKRLGGRITRAFSRDGMIQP